MNLKTMTFLLFFLFFPDNSEQKPLGGAEQAWEYGVQHCGLGLKWIRKMFMLGGGSNGRLGMAYWSPHGKRKAFI